MLVSLESLKGVLGISPDDTSSDLQLPRLARAATLWIEGYTHRRFGVPVPRVEYREGSNEPCFILAGHIDDLAASENPSETADPATSLVIASRALPRQSGDTWQNLVEGADWERREDDIIALGAWGVWQCNLEYRLTYLDGFAVPPDDILQVLYEMVINQRAIERTIASGLAGVTSETIGDFRYSIDLSAVGAGGNTILSQTSMWTLNGYRRLLVG